jgi:hypothetical protein
MLWTFQLAALKVIGAWLQGPRVELLEPNTRRNRVLLTLRLMPPQGNPIEALIRTCLLEDRSAEKSFSYTPKDGAPYTLKWRLHNVGDVLAHHACLLIRPVKLIPHL